MSLNDPILEMYIFENSQLIEQLEATILESEKSNSYPPHVINEIFRVMHTVKGSSTMMQFDNLASLSHHLEDLFSFIREQKPQIASYTNLSDLVLEFVDFTKVEIHKIQNQEPADGSASLLIERIQSYLSDLKNGGISSVYTTNDSRKLFKATLFFEDGCQMENVRAFQVVQRLNELIDDFTFIPEDIIENNETVEIIRQQGFQLMIRTEQSYEEIHEYLSQSSYLHQLEVTELLGEQESTQLDTLIVTKDSGDHHSPNLGSEREPNHQEMKNSTSSPQPSSFISVDVTKLDGLMDLVGELVIAEAMTTQNPDLIGLELEQFRKAARHLRKITTELQDLVMSIRMVPLVNTFHKMHRVVRDMSKKLNKEVQLILIGEHTEVDKNIIEHISDPIMHMVRNAIDHGIEDTEERISTGKPPVAKLTLEARNAGSEVLIIVREDGRGLNKEKILRRAKHNQLLHRSESEMSDKEIFNLIFLPGFSTKDSISEFSGRGVGLDVVMRNIEMVGGAVAVDSIQGEGTTVTIKIPLTLAIIDGMNLRVGSSRYTLPTTAIKESFRSKQSDVITDPDRNEMIMVRGQCYPILRLHERFKVNTDIVTIDEGILIMVEQEGRRLCLFADELLGQQQVVVKALPTYMKSIRTIEGISGCTLLGDGSISLILDVLSIINKKKL